MSSGAATARTLGRGRTSAPRRAEPAAAAEGRSCGPRPPDRRARRRLTGIVAIAAGLLSVALVLRTAGPMSGLTALELEAVLGLPVWLLLWRRTRITAAREPE